ncbi:MAG: glycosyltransferase family 4 protein [Herpetosiphonaceae bacterium]|nr:glycosyltransferase family 4 protein [Herpetosiphonaceae bacterium]
MHIVHYNLTTTTKVGGVETFVWNIAAQQAQRGHRVTILGGAGPLRHFSPGVAVRTVPFIDRDRFAVGPLRRAYAWRKLAERLSMLPAAWPLLRDADLVHIHKPYDLPLAPLLARRGVPLVYHGHGEDFFRGDRQLMGWVPLLFSCSSYNAATLRQRYGREPIVVFNGVDTSLFQPQPADSTLRAALVGSGQFVVLLPGRMMPWKGHATALQALQQLNNPAVRLVIVGDGEVRATLEQTTQALGIEDQVVFTGTIGHQLMPQYVAAADVVLGTSFASETFGMALAEAQACGIAVLASSWQGYDDVVRDQVTGRRFSAADPASLAAVLGELLNDLGQRDRLGAAGHAHVGHNFTWQQIAARIESGYEALPSYERSGPREG